MASNKLKVPSSARRHIKIEQFTQFVSASRLRHVQSIIQKRDDIDSILAIAGIDSRYNEGNLDLLNYLLFGFFDVRKDEFERSGFAEEVIDDMMILVCPGHAEIYCNPINYHYLLPYVSHWPSVQFHCMAENEYEGEDDDASEEFKINSLIGMTSSCNSIGIPYFGRAYYNEECKVSSTGGGAKFNPMDVEKWPVIQATALEDFGGGGFFTMKHEVYDISLDLQQVYNLQDPVSMEILLTESFPLMARQWDNMMKCIQIALSESVKPVLPAKKIAEPLKSYFNHGLVGHKGRDGCKPFVLINSAVDKQKLKTMLAQGDGCIGDVSLESESVHTLICQAVSPHSPLICSRTYFITKQPYIINSGGSGDSASEDQMALRYLVGVYLAMVHAVMAAVERYTHTSSTDKARRTLVEDLTEGCEQVETKELRSYFNDGSNIEFTLEAISCDNRGLPLTEGQYSPCMKHLCLTLHQLPPPPGVTTGPRTLMFGETFLDSRLHVKGAPDVGSDYLILTACIPRYHLASICVAKHFKKSASTPALPADHWGDHLMSHDNIDLAVTWAALLPPEKVILSVWEHGLSVESHSYGSFVIHKSQMKAISMYDGDSMTQVALLSIVLRPSAALRSQLPPHLQVDFEQCGQCQVLLGVSPHSKAHTELYGKVLPVWKESGSAPTVERPDSLDGDLWPIHRFLQHKLDAVSRGADTPLKKVAAANPDLYEYLDHLSMSSCLQQPISKTVFTALTDHHNTRASNIDKIIVSVISGAPGSDKEAVGTLLTTFNTNIINWLVYKQPEECRLDTNFLHRSMSSALQSHDMCTPKKTTRVVFIAPGFCDTSAVVAGLESHPDPKVRSEFIIGAVTVCIDPRNFYMDHKLTLPSLLSQCAQGWLNNIVFTSQTLAPSELLDNVQSLVRSINSDVALLKAENGEVKRSTDLDLIMSETAFQDKAFVKARLLMKPVGLSGPQVWPCCPAMNDIMIRFTRPLEKHLTLIKLRGIKASMSPYPFDGNIYFVRGYLAFSGSTTPVDLQFSPLSGRLSMTDSKTPSSSEDKVYIVAFTGVNLKEADLKALLETCVKQKPEKKKLLRKGDLSKKEIDKIHSKHHLDELPEGWFYNGSQFVSMAGERSTRHPSLDDFIQAYLDNKNSDIEKFNSRIDTEEYTSLFK